VIRIWTGTVAQLGTCDHCNVPEAPVEMESDAVVTAVTLHRGDALVFLARLCQRHFLQFSDLVSDQVASLLYPAVGDGRRR